MNKGLGGRDLALLSEVSVVCGRVTCGVTKD